MNIYLLIFAMANPDLGDLSAFERMLYGNVEDDPELEAELMAIQNEMDFDEISLPPTTTKRPAVPAPIKKAPAAPAPRKIPSPPAAAPIKNDDNAEEEYEEPIDVEGDIDDPELESELLALENTLGRVVDEKKKEMVAVSSTTTAATTSKLQPPSLPPPLVPIRAVPAPPPPYADVPSSDPSNRKKCVVEENVVEKRKCSPSPPPPQSKQQMVEKQEITTPPPKSAAAAAENAPKQEQEPAESVIINDGDAAFSEKATAAAFKAPPAPSSVLEALQQRLEKYKSASEQAKNEQNASKSRRMGRIQKQYEDAIKAYKAGRPVDFEELPTPPGFGPIPIATAPPPPPRRPISTSSTSPSSSGPAAAAAVQQTGQQKPVAAVKPSQHRHPPQQTAFTSSSSKQAQELDFLIERQHQFKEAALAAKKRGDLPTAKHLLKQSMGFDQMIAASRNGLRVDIASVPTPPQLKTGPISTKPQLVIGGEADDHQSSTSDSAASSTKEGDILAKAGYEEVYSMLEQDLINQIQICDRNREFYLNVGEVGKVSEFEKLGSGAKKDLAALRNAFKHKDPTPRFHYETRIFPSIKCFPELGVYDLELSIVRGIHLKLPSGYEPKDAEIYVKYDFGYPKETPQSGKTGKIKGTNSPAFEATSILRINPKSRQFLHMLKRIGIKFEVMQKGGFLRSDISLGTAEVKLLPLETQPLLHQSLDVIENRKPVGGKLEVKIRVREPLVNQKQAEDVREKWLVIDQFSTTSTNAAVFGSRQLGTNRKM